VNRALITPAQFAAFGAAGTDAHRMFSDGDGWIERLAEDVLISHKSDAALDAMREGLAEWTAANGWQPRRIFGKLLPKQNEDRDPPVLLSGDAAMPLTGVVCENGVSYGLDFAAGYSAGLFLDQRMNRAFVRNAAPKRMLNTFAYTCSFSVVAALAGAETVSIDLSKKSCSTHRHFPAATRAAAGRSGRIWRSW
jgi:23S rRNA (cytosine1962-C5)-methyltransferase